MPHFEHLVVGHAFRMQRLLRRRGSIVSVCMHTNGAVSAAGPTAAVFLVKPCAKNRGRARTGAGNGLGGDILAQRSDQTNPSPNLSNRARLCPGFQNRWGRTRVVQIWSGRAHVWSNLAQLCPCSAEANPDLSIGAECCHRRAACEDPASVVLSEVPDRIDCASVQQLAHMAGPRRAETGRPPEKWPLVAVGGSGAPLDGSWSRRHGYRCVTLGPPSAPEV